MAHKQLVNYYELNQPQNLVAVCNPTEVHGNSMKTFA